MIAKSFIPFLGTKVFTIMERMYKLPQPYVSAWGVRDLWR